MGYLIGAIIIGLIMGFALAALMTLNSIAKSNMMGDSQGEFEDFSSQPMQMIQSRDSKKLSLEEWQRTVRDKGNQPI